MSSPASVGQIARLSDRGVLRVAGAQSREFLQGLVTNSMDGARAGMAVHTGLLTPQGKILFDFFVTETESGFLLDCPKHLAAELLRRLTFYRLRAAVDLIDLTGEHEVWAAWGGAPPAPGAALAVFPDPRLATLGHRLIAAADTGVPVAGATEVPEADYHAHRIAQGVPEGGRDFAFGDAFPHEADFDQLNGIDFHKGCFVGQEVVSRMHHRGTARKRVVPVEGDGPLQSGAEIVAGEAPIGTLGSVAGTRGLALLRLDRVAKAVAEGARLRAGDVPIRLRQPDWASFKVPV